MSMSDERRAELQARRNETRVFDGLVSTFMEFVHTQRAEAAAQAPAGWDDQIMAELFLDHLSAMVNTFENMQCLYVHRGKPLYIGPSATSVWQPLPDPHTKEPGS